MRRRAGLLAVVVLALGAGACSSDDGSDDDAAPTEPSDALVADFTYEADYRQLGPTNCPLKDVQFTDRSTGDPERWSWELSDGSTSTEPDPRVTTFVHEATLTVTRGDETDSITKPVELVSC